MLLKINFQISMNVFFHLNQAIWKHIQYHGLAKQYSDNVSFTLEVRKLPVLSFIPVDKVIQSFELLLESSKHILCRNRKIVITPNNLF